MDQTNIIHSSSGNNSSANNHFRYTDASGNGNGANRSLSNSSSESDQSNHNASASAASYSSSNNNAFAAGVHERSGSISSNGSQQQFRLSGSSTPSRPLVNSSSTSSLNFPPSPSPSPGPQSAPGMPAEALRKRVPSDFEFGDVLGEGSYSTVVLAKEKSTGKHFAVKILEKKHIIKEKKVKYVNTEKSVLNKINHPFFVRLYYTFQDAERLYFVISYASNGELLHTIKRLGSFDERSTQFYAAELVVALEYMHGLGIIHRDLKPENILLDTDMHIKITDFGSAKILGEDSDEDAPGKHGSFVGTAEYVSPELLTEKTATKASDLWALGCIIYQLLSGRPPFRAGNEYQTFQKITKLEYSIPNGFPPAARDLVEKLLVLDPWKRLGSEATGGFNAIKSHPFFRGVDFNLLHLQRPPELLPYLPAISRNSLPLHSSSSLNEETEEIAAQTALSSFTITAPDRQGMRQQLLLKQAQESQWHRFVQVDELIIKTGIIHKRKGLFSKRRQLVLTDKPRCFYVDVDKMEVKGEVPWSTEMRFEMKNKKTFFIHTPNRTYYLEDLSADAQGWVDQFQTLLKQYRATIAAGMQLRAQQNLEN